MLFSSLTNLLVIAILTTLAFAQADKLPPVLEPDAESKAEAERVGGKVFKLLPRKMFPDVPGSYSDQDNPIGRRGGGWCYSFSSEHHSYNRTPEIRLYDTSVASGALGGISFVANLGPRDLSLIDGTLPEADFFLSYKPPLLLKDVELERKSLHGRKVGTLTLIGPQHVVHYNYRSVYLLRSSTWDMADIVVAFRVLKQDLDGSITIVWKKLASFPAPIVLRMTDQEFKEKMDQGYKIGVINNQMYLQEPYPPPSIPK